MFGLPVWGVSYFGLLPSLDLFPKAKDDSPSRQAVVIAAHVVYGTSMASCEEFLRNASVARQP